MAVTDQHIKLSSAQVAAPTALRENLMYRFARLIPVFGTALLLGMSPAAAAPIANAEDAGAAILACWTPPADTNGSFVTLSFSFKRDGTLIGPPRPTEIQVGGDEDAKKQYVDAAIAALQSCLPLDFSSAFAQGVGGQVFTLQFASPDQ